MLIVGDLSGIQDYLFDIAHEGGGQARRLRARSFFIQMLAECAALRVRRAVDWGPASVVFSGAGKFILSGPTLTIDETARVQAERENLDRWLLAQAGGKLKLSLVLDSVGGAPVEEYERAMLALQREKLRPWGRIATVGGAWNSDVLVLDPLDIPCAICRHRRAEPEFEEEDSETGAIRRVCSRCHWDAEIGRKLPRMKWMVLQESVGKNELDVAGLSVILLPHPPASPRNGDLAAANLERPEDPPAGWPPDRVLLRRLARHIPSNQHGAPLEFSEIAQAAQGDNLLGVLKMDGDSLGVAMSSMLRGAPDLEGLGDFSRKLDDFVAGTLDAELRKPGWSKIYTIFAGGDDLLLVGPWSTLFEYAGHARELFMKAFGKERLTISAGLAFFRPRRPIRRAAEEAERLLELAKTRSAPNANDPKDQMASFGQIWKWKDHQAILDAGRRLAGWVDTRKAQRGWLNTLLHLAKLRHGQAGLGKTESLQATARLDYHVTRNYPRTSDRDPAKGELRRWADRLIHDFDQVKHVETTFLPAIVRYALTATRAAAEEE